MATPQINDVDIPQPSAASPPSFEEAYRGTGREMADGSAVFDWITTGRKHVWSLKWTALTSTQMETLRTAYNTVAGSASTKWEPTDGGAYYVTLDPKNMAFKCNLVPVANGGIRYDVEFNLREV